MLFLLHGMFRGTEIVHALSLVVLAVLFASSRALHAAEGEPGQREMMLFEEPLVTAATRHAQTLDQAPSAVTIITREDIRRFGYRNLVEALRSVPGFYSSYDRNYAYVGVRGFLVPGDSNNRILLLVNGHTYNDDIYATAFVDSTFGIDMEAIERIEVVRGPGSALYGGSAVFAVINVVTATATDLPGVRTVLETGSYYRKRAELSVGHVFDSGLEIFASGSVLDLDGQENLFYPEYDDPATNNGIAHDVDDEQALNLFLSARYGGFYFQGGANRREKHVPTGSYATTFNDPDNKTTDSRPFADLSYTTELSPELLAFGRVFYDGYIFHGTYVFGSGPDRVPYKDTSISHWFGSELRTEWRPSPDHVVTVGTEYTYHPDATQTDRDSTTGQYYVDDHRSFGIWGIYAQEEWSVLPTLTLTTGLRYDRYYNGIEKVSPRAALVWNPLSGTHLKLLYGRAFRPPDLYELYYSSVDPQAQYLANPGLHEESIDTYEAVLDQDLWHGAHLQLSAYHYDIDGLIELVRLPDQSGNLSVQFQNSGKASANGVEVALLVPITDDVDARVGYSFQQARNDELDERLTNSPEHLADVALLFPLPLDVQAGAEVQIVSPRKTLTGNEVRTAVIGNVTLNRELPLPGLSTSVGFYNIFNQNYADPGGPEHEQDQIPQDKFTFRFQLQYRF